MVESSQELLEVLNDLHIYIAPAIEGNDFVKRVILLQMFMIPLRGERLHLLLIGEPATGKSYLAHEFERIFPNTKFFGTHITPVGFMEEIPEYDGGTIIIDEFDKHPSLIQKPLYEILENQTLTIDRHGDHIRIPARMNLSAIINPHNDRLVPNMPLDQQIPERFRFALISRFDFIAPFRAPPPSRWSNISENLASKKMEDDEKRIRVLHEKISHIKEKLSVVEIPPDIARDIGQKTAWLKESSAMKRIVSLRTIRGFQFMVKARARMLMKKEATPEDVEYVWRLYDHVYNSRWSSRNDI